MSLRFSSSFPSPFVLHLSAYALAGLMGSVALYARQAPGWQWGLMLSFALWPVILRAMAPRLRDAARIERHAVQGDAALAGAMLPLMAFHLLPCAAVLTVTLMDKITPRRRALLAHALPFLAGGALLGYAVVQPRLQFDTPLLVELATVPFLALHFLAAIRANWRQREMVSEQSRRLEQAAQEDPTTGLLARDSLIARAATALAFSHSRDMPSSLALIDLDGFRRVNQVFGHQAADEYLRAVGLRLRQSVRQGTLVGRYGADQFAVLLPATPLADAEYAARRLLAAIGTLRLADWPGLQATCSVSLVATSPAYPGIREWLTAAERALQQAKAAGGNRIEAVR